MNPYAVKALAALIFVLSFASWAAAGRPVYARKAAGFPTRCWPALPKMNVCYIARLDCPNCGASVLIECDKVTEETPTNEP